MNGHVVRPMSLLVALTSAALVAGGCSVGSPSVPASATAPTATASTAVPSATIAAAPSPTNSAAPSAIPSAAPSFAATLPRDWQLCTNSHAGYAIGYPAGWYTTQLNSEQVCQQFDPMPFTIPIDGEYPMTALNAVQTTEAFDLATSATADPLDARTIIREETTVGGRRAVRYEWAITDTGLYPDGTMRYGYAIDRDGREFALFTMANPTVSPNEYADWKAVVDQALDTLRFD